jgi:hypothetical protein
MSVPQKKLIRRITLAIATVGLLVPVTVSPGQGIERNDACADGSCCRELNSVCLKDGSSTMHYYQSDGACGETKLQ